jgi:hypothetical protein
MAVKRECDMEGIAWFAGTLGACPSRLARVWITGAPGDHALSAFRPAGRTSTIQHWQLRDLLHCPESDGELFCVHRNRTLCYDVNNDRVCPWPCVLLRPLLSHRAPKC